MFQIMFSKSKTKSTQVGFSEQYVDLSRESHLKRFHLVNLYTISPYFIFDFKVAFVKNIDAKDY